MYKCVIENLYFPYCTNPCFHKMSFSKRNSGITWLASLTSCVSRGGLAVNHQIFNILRLVFTKLCLRIDVTWINKCYQMFWFFSSGETVIMDHLKTWCTVRFPFLKSQYSSLFTPYNTSSLSDIVLFFSNFPNHIFVWWYLLPLFQNQRSWGHCFLKTEQRIISKLRH